MGPHPGAGPPVPKPGNAPGDGQTFWQSEEDIQRSEFPRNAQPYQHRECSREDPKAPDQQAEEKPSPPWTSREGALHQDECQRRNPAIDAFRSNAHEILGNGAEDGVASIGQVWTSRHRVPGEDQVGDSIQGGCGNCQGEDATPFQAGAAQWAELFHKEESVLRRCHLQGRELLTGRQRGSLHRSSVAA